MGKDARADQVREFKPRPEELLERVRSLARDSKNVGFSEHAEERMEQRGITDLDALRILRSGELSGPVEAGRNKGEWKCKIVAAIKGRREAGVVTILIKNRRLRIKTVEWEDLR